MEKRFRAPSHPHVDQIVNESISKLAEYSGLILTIWLVVVFAVRFYVFEAFLMRRLYGDKYTGMTSETVRRGFVNHHVAGLVKLVLLAAAAYPFVAVAFGSASMHSPYDGRGGSVTMGDVLVVCSQLFISMYVFELFYRPKISPVSALHHIGAIVIAQSAVAISLDFEHEVDATIEFILCFVWGKQHLSRDGPSPSLPRFRPGVSTKWETILDFLLLLTSTLFRSGAFDVIAEFWPHLAIILYRIYPDNHSFLCKVFRAAFITELAGTTIETAVVMWLFAGLWDRWTLSFKVTTPILHFVFSAAQLWGAIIFRRMWKHQERLLAEEERAGQLPKVNPLAEKETSKTEVVEYMVDANGHEPHSEQ